MTHTKCPKCGREAIHVSSYPKWDREGKFSAKNYIHSYKTKYGLTTTDDYCIVRKPIQKAKA